MNTTEEVRMTRSMEELERLEKELKERVESTDALERVKAAESMPYPKVQSARPVHRSTRGQWQSQSKGGILLPRRRQ